MEITLNIRLAHSKDSNYTFNVDFDREGDFKESTSLKTTPKSEVGAVRRPSAERLNFLKHPELRAEEEATEQVMDRLELDG